MPSLPCTSAWTSCWWYASSLDSYSMSWAMSASAEFVELLTFWSTHHKPSIYLVKQSNLVNNLGHQPAFHWWNPYFFHRLLAVVTPNLAKWLGARGRPRLRFDDRAHGMPITIPPPIVHPIHERYICIYFLLWCLKNLMKTATKNAHPLHHFIPFQWRSEVWCGRSHWGDDLCGAQRGLLSPSGPCLQRGAGQQLEAEDTTGAGGHRSGDGDGRDGMAAGISQTQRWRHWMKLGVKPNLDMRYNRI